MDISELYVACCTEHGVGMNEGYVVQGDPYSREEDVLPLATEAGYKDLDEAYNDGFFYWTSWWDDREFFIEEQGYGYDAQGKKHLIEKQEL